MLVMNLVVLTLSLVLILVGQSKDRLDILTTGICMPALHIAVLSLLFMINF